MKFSFFKKYWLILRGFLPSLPGNFVHKVDYFCVLISLTSCLFGPLRLISWSSRRNWVNFTFYWLCKLSIFINYFRRFNSAQRLAANQRRQIELCATIKRTYFFFTFFFISDLSDMTIETEIRSWLEKLAVSRPKNREMAKLGEFMCFLTENISPNSKYANNTEIFGHFKRFIELVQTSKKVMVLFQASWKSIYSIRISSKCFSGEE